MREPDPLPELAVRTHSHLLEASGDDPWVRYAVANPLPGAAWELDGARLSSADTGGCRVGMDWCVLARPLPCRPCLLEPWPPERGWAPP